MLATNRETQHSELLRVLWVATKAPWPPIDGGRRLMWETLQALSSLPVEITLVAPVSDQERAGVEDALRPLCQPELVSGSFHQRPSWPRIALRFGRSLVARKPMSAWRHRNSKSRERVNALLHQHDFDLVHVEQPQALEVLPNDPIPPVLLRAQNVESDLWRDLSRNRRGPLGLALRVEAARLARWEAAALARARIIAAISRTDRKRLAALANLPSSRVVYHPAPFPAPLEPSAVDLEGDPALVVFGGSGWLLSELGARHFVDRVWSDVSADMPGARLHVFGAPFRPHLTLPSVDFHPAPEDSRTVFARNAVLLVPLQVSSGVRIKILEAWARSCAVVATRIATAGLGDDGGRALEVVNDLDSAQDWLAALRRIRDRGIKSRLCERGLDLVTTHHAPGPLAHRLFQLYRQVAGRGDSRLEERFRGSDSGGFPRPVRHRIGDAAFEGES